MVPQLPALLKFWSLPLQEGIEDKTASWESWLGPGVDSPYLLSWIDPPEFHLNVGFPEDCAEDTDVIPTSHLVWGRQDGCWRRASGNWKEARDRESEVESVWPCRQTLRRILLFEQRCNVSACLPASRPTSGVLCGLFSTLMVWGACLSRTPRPGPLYLHWERRLKVQGIRKLREKKVHGERASRR